MAGNHADHTTHRLVSGELPTVGLEVYTNNLDRGTITKVATDPGCGSYCNAWHTITLHTSYKGLPMTGTTDMNCDRLTTRKPR